MQESHEVSQYRLLLNEEGIECKRNLNNGCEVVYKICYPKIQFQVSYNKLQVLVNW